MFQIESRAQMSCLPRLRPTRFYDIVVQVAIIRPGPIVGQMVNPFLMRRQGRQEVVYPHPSLETVLKRTLGVPLFQEQLLRMAMIAAGFSGGEAEELRRAFGFKRSEKRMRDIEVKLREGMKRNGIPAESQEQIILSITSFALYGFPESHAASFALIAYASAYLKCHYLAAFTAALLNNQPMGFYHPSTIVKDAQRHGLRVKPVDITCSDWSCTLEPDGNTTRWESVEGARLELRRALGVTKAALDAAGTSNAQEAESPQWLKPHCYEQLGGVPEGAPLQYRNCEQRFALRMGFRYAKGLREDTAQAILRERSKRRFESIADLTYRVPELRRNELVLLASIGALNSIGHAKEEELLTSLAPSRKGKKQRLHRRDALWQVERVARFAGPLLENIPESDAASPLALMTPEERLVADFHGTGLTVGPHPLAYRRADLKRAGVFSAKELTQIPHGRHVRTAGCVIARQRPGTAKGFVFLSLEDETGISNAIITPDLLEQNRILIVSEKFLLLEGVLQNQDGVISVKVERVSPLRDSYTADTVDITDADVRSHDFH
jgi:error-prone DNA polymerase